MGHEGDINQEVGLVFSLDFSEAQPIMLQSTFPR